MKKAMLVLVLLVGYMAYAQQDMDTSVNRLRKREYRITVNSLYTGYLVHITDSSLKLSNGRHPFGREAETETYLYHQVDNVHILPAANPVTGALIGSVLGIVAGGIVGNSVYKHQHPNNRVLFYDLGLGIASVEGAAIGAATGAVAGILIGQIKHKFQVNRDRDNFKKLYARIIR
jgi:hypothetical protein